MYYGFDIGGSKIALGIYDQQRQLQWSRRVPTPCDNYEQLLQVLETLTREADQFTGEAGTVGIGLPGRIDSRSGTLLSVNIPAVCGRALGQDLTQRLAREVRLDNDANCFTLSEAWDAEFQRYPVVAGIILGTGVGGGIVIEGKPVAGCHAVAGEFGHLRLPVDALEIVGAGIPLLPCGCGKSGCIEPYLSGPGFARLFQLWYGESLSVPAIIARYAQGDPLARAHTARYQLLLAVCLGSLLTLLDPHLVVFGGGLSNFTALYDGLTERVANVLLPGVCPPRFSPARHGDAGGMRGAAFLHLR